VNELISKHQQQTKLVQAATQNTKADTGNAANATKQTSVPNTSAPAVDAKVKTAMLDALVKQISRQGTVQTEVSSSQRLDTKAQQLLAKANPTLAAQMQSQNQSTNVSSNLSNQAPTATPTAMYLVKLSQMANTTTNSASTNTTANQATVLLTTITPTPFKIGDQLQLQLNSQQQITIKPSVASVRPVIADSLKSALPQQQNLSLLLNTLTVIGKLPPVTQDLLLAKNTQTALQQLTQFAYTDKQLNSANNIKNALANSGVLTENKLQQQQVVSSDLRTALGQLSQALGQTLTQTSASSESPIPKAAVDQLITQLIQQLPQAIINAKPTADNISKQVTAIMQLLGFKPDAYIQADIKKIKDVAAKKIGQMAQGVQDKIHLNQLRLLGADTQSSDSYVASHAANKSNAFISEIALRWGDQVLPLQLSIAEEKEHKRESNQGNTQEEAKQEDKKISRRWQVFMSFDLPSTSLHNDGTDTLHSQLTIVGDTISATLWSESSALCYKAKQQFSNLRNTLIANGLQVDELLCINGKPPSQKMSLDYHLVDITT
jgi:uncharacterized protein YqfB (UPF0267 family)